MKILIIDDEVSLKEIYIKFLEKINATAIFHDHPQKGWQAIDKEEYDLIITDLKMPIISGEEFISIVRSSKLNAHTPIILCSGHINKLVMTEMARESKIYFLTKPFDSSSLLDLVKKALSIKSGETALNQGLNEKWLAAFGKKMNELAGVETPAVKLDHFELWNFESVSLSFVVVKNSKMTSVEDSLNVSLVMKIKTFLKIAGKIQGTQYKEIETETLHVWQQLLSGVMTGTGRVSFSKILSQEFIALPEKKDIYFKISSPLGEVLVYLN